jgi:hypothetical protein
MNTKNLKQVFISYSWEDKEHNNWVETLAKKLSQFGIEVTLDKDKLEAGDRIAHFMEQAIANNSLIIIVCTEIYKSKADERIGGVGYETDILTGNKLYKLKEQKIIPILKKGSLRDSIPIWLAGTLYLDFTKGDEEFNTLTELIFGNNEAVIFQEQTERADQHVELSDVTESSKITEVRIIEVLIDEISLPRLDGTPGSGLYKIPLLLNIKPSATWIRYFEKFWKRPTYFSQMHRPEIAKVIGNKILLDGTTLEELKKYHKRTLDIVISDANARYVGEIDEAIGIAAAKKKMEDELRKEFNDLANQIRFN